MDRRNALGLLLSGAIFAALSQSAQALPATDPKNLENSAAETGFEKSWWRRRWGWRRRWRRW